MLRSISRAKRIKKTCNITLKVQYRVQNVIFDDYGKKSTLRRLFQRLEKFIANFFAGRFDNFPNFLTILQ